MTQPPDSPAQPGYFDEPRPVPRYRGVSDPVGRGEGDIQMRLHQQQAMHRALVDWARSPDMEHWLPGDLTVQVVDDYADYFVRGQVVFAASMRGAPVFTGAEIAEVARRWPRPLWVPPGQPVAPNSNPSSEPSKEGM